MQKVSYSRHRFPPLIIQHAIWLYFKFSLSYRDVEDLLAERGIDVSYETVRRWVLKFGSIYAGKLNRTRPRPSGQWHLDEMFILINGNNGMIWPTHPRQGRSETQRQARRCDHGCPLLHVTAIQRRPEGGTGTQGQALSPAGDQRLP